MTEISNIVNSLFSIAFHYCVIVVLFYTIMPSCIADKVPTSILSLFRKK